MMCAGEKPSPPPPTLAAVIGRVQAYVRTQPRRKRALAAQVGVAPNTLGRVEAPDWRPSLDTLARLEAVIPHGWNSP